MDETMRTAETAAEEARMPEEPGAEYESEEETFPAEPGAEEARISAEPDAAYGEEETFAGADDAYGEEELAAWEALHEAYPEINAENIPEDVLRLVSEGETPLHAMRQVENGLLKEEIASLRQKLAAAENGQRNRFRSVGSLLGRAAVREDAFLSGLEE